MKTTLLQYYKFLKIYLKPLYRKVLLLATLLCLNTAMMLIKPQIIRYFMDTALQGTVSHSLFLMTILYMLSVAFQELISVAAANMKQKIGWTATNTLRLDLIRHCLNLDLTFHKEHQPAELTERVDSDVNALFELLSSLAIDLIMSIMIMTGIAGLLFREDWRLGLALVIYTAAAITVLWRKQQTHKSYWEEEYAAHADLLGFAAEQTGGLEDIKACGAVPNMFNKYYTYTQKWVATRLKAFMSNYTTAVFTIGVFSLGGIIMYGTGGVLKMNGAITIGTLYLIISYFELIRDPIDQIKSQVQELQKASAGIARIDQLLHTKSKITDTAVSLLPEGPLSVLLKDVSFNYDPNTPVIENLSLELSEGKVLGVLGRTGSGKTTIARLLARLYDPDSGDIIFGNCNIKSVPIKNLRQRIAYVTQDIQLFHATVRDNVTFFNKYISDNEILNAFEQMGLQGWLNSLPYRLDTMLDTNGGGLSAGEAQLLAFTRVLLKDPGLVILDEATSMLDKATERLVEQALDRLLKGRTCILIAHRIDTLIRADDILILESGKKTEHSSREALSEDSDSVFYKLMHTSLEEVLA